MLLHSMLKVAHEDVKSDSGHKCGKTHGWRSIECAGVPLWVAAGFKLLSIPAKQLVLFRADVMAVSFNWPFLHESLFFEAHSNH